MFSKESSFNIFKQDKVIIFLTCSKLSDFILEGSSLVQLVMVNSLG